MSTINGKHSMVPVVRNSTVTRCSVTTNPDSRMAHVDLARCSNFFPAAREDAATWSSGGSCLNVIVMGDIDDNDDDGGGSSCCCCCLWIVVFFRMDVIGGGGG